MSAYLYAIIPYKSKEDVVFDETDSCIFFPVIPELKDIESEFANQESLILHKGFLVINTCYRQSAFTENQNGYNWMREEIYKIAKALNACEVWYVEELVYDEMDSSGFSFDQWRESLKTEKASYVVELSVDVLKGSTVYSYYHDDFSDIILKESL